MPFVHLLKVEGVFDSSASKTSTYYICSGCQAFYDQPLGRMVEKPQGRSGGVNYSFKTHSGPTVPDKCPECRSTLHVGSRVSAGLFFFRCSVPPSASWPNVVRLPS
jgi:tRNA (guanine26-N2/guanine27-N2)-dimethyltransferase